MKLPILQLLVLIIFRLSEGRSYSSQRSVRHTSPPDCSLVSGKVGVCVDLSRCSVVVQLLQNLQKPLPKDVSLLLKESFFCGVGEQGVAVCCPPTSVTPPLPERRIEEDLGGCSLQGGEPAACVPYSHCNPFIQLLSNLRKPLPVAVPVVMREVYLCGRELTAGGAVIPKICCPSDAVFPVTVVGEATTTATTTAPTTTAAPRSLPPPQVTVLSATPDSVTVRLDPAAGTSPGSYRILYRREAEAGWTGVEVGPVAGDGVKLDGLVCGTLYHVKAVSFASDEEGPASNAVEAKTTGTPPPVPRMSQLLSVNSHSVRILLSSLQDGGCPLTHLEIEYRARGSQDWTTVEGIFPAKEFTIFPLTPETGYDLTLKIENTAGLTTALHQFSTPKDERTTATTTTTTATTTLSTEEKFSMDWYNQHPGMSLVGNLETCGRPSVVVGMTRIVGGKPAALGQFPWIVNIGYSVPNVLNSSFREINFNCGGTLIGSRHILTAAHCVASLPTNYILDRIRVGEHDLSNTDPDCEKQPYGLECAPLPQDFSIASVTIHPQYNKPYRFNNDIALIKLEGVVSISDYVSPICLPFPIFSEISAKLDVAGWGAVDMYARRFSDVLQYVQVPVFDFASCSDIYLKQKVRIIESQLCAGGEKNKDSCSGDSGSGLMGEVTILNRPYDPRWIQVGVVSFGPRRCATDGVPAIYANVSSYLPWILDTVLL